MTAPLSESFTGHITEYSAASSAVLRDTDADRLTDPTKVDSDGDGVSDAQELQVGSDPTLFDVRPPTIQVRYAQFTTTVNPPGTEYRLSFVAEGPGGVRQTW